MPPKNHYAGFEREEKYNNLFSLALAECPVLKAKTFRLIIEQICPEFLAGLFERKPCVRNLKYTGMSGESEPANDSFFEHGKIYESIDFNGATYNIKDYENGANKLIGSAYFEWVE